MAALSNPRHEKFAAHVASGLSASEAYVKAGYSKVGARVSASRLLTNANVSRRVSELTERVTSAVVEAEISRRECRIAAQQERWQLMQQLRAARAAEYGKPGKNGKPLVPGAETGLMAQTFKTVGSGPKQQIVPEFSFDAPLLKEMRELEKQAAIEMGQWSEKKELTGKNGAPLAMAPPVIQVMFVDSEDGGLSKSNPLD